jgi:acetyl-CoA/propionyl-CoA carboxylase biotin carboxyl carrier protein
VTDEALTPRQVADELGVTVRTVQRWIADGRLPAERVGGRMRVSRSSLPSVVAEVPRSADAPRGIRRLLIANRGEIAARVARTARALGIHTVGVHEPQDRSADELDEAHPIDSYLDAEAILVTAARTRADAVHPGYGFLAENPAFARAVVAAGLAWVGPPPEAIEAVGDKAAARRVAAARGVPVLPGYDGAAQDDAAFVAAATRIGYPLLVKPSAGGGGKGMRAVRAEDQLPDALAAARREARGAFGDDRLILEHLLDGSRHVEVQVLFDGHGHGVHLGERDCSAQRRNQKIVEEAPAPSVSDEMRAQMGVAALDVAAAVGYASAGTVEFLVRDDAFFFLEMNARLQVEHPVSEAVTGRDLVADQLRIAAGGPLGLSQADIRHRGHAIEARLYAEDPEAGFLPASGRILRLRWPGGVRIDTGIQEGDVVSDRYDPMLAKLIAHGATRDAALDQLRAALDGTLVLGVRTNLRFLRWLLDQPVMRQAQVRTDTIDGLRLPGSAQPTEAQWRAAAGALLAEGPHGPWGGGWRASAPAAVRMRLGDEERRVALDGDVDAEVATAGGTAYVAVDGQSVELSLAMPPNVEEAVRHASAGAGDVAALVAPMPGRVIAVRAGAGTSVQAHAAVVVIEAMKMEHAVVTPLAGTVTNVAVRVGQQVQRGDLLAEVSA